VCGKHKQPRIWGRRAQEGKEIDQDVGGEFDGAGGMVDRLSRIITHDERVRPQRLGAVRTGFVQARHSREQTVVVVDDEHLGVLLHNSLRDLPIALVKKECRQWSSGWQEGLPVWTPQRREVFNEEVS